MLLFYVKIELRIRYICTDSKKFLTVCFVYIFLKYVINTKLRFKFNMKTLLSSEMKP